MDKMRHAPKTVATLGELRARIESGRYEVKTDRVAEVMLRRVNFRPASPKARRD